MAAHNVYESAPADVRLAALMDSLLAMDRDPQFTHWTTEQVVNYIRHKVQEHGLSIPVINFLQQNPKGKATSYEINAHCLFRAPISKAYWNCSVVLMKSDGKLELFVY